MNEILSKGTSGNLVIMGMTMYDWKWIKVFQ